MRSGAKIFQDIDLVSQEFDAGEFVKVQGKGNIHHGRFELVIDKIRRVLPERDATEGFREDDCIPTSPRPARRDVARARRASGERRAPGTACAARPHRRSARRSACASGRPRGRFTTRTEAGCSSTSSRSWRPSSSSRSSTARGAICSLPARSCTTSASCASCHVRRHHRLFGRRQPRRPHHDWRRHGARRDPRDPGFPAGPRARDRAFDPLASRVARARVARACR